MVRNEGDLHRKAKRRIASILRSSSLYDNVMTDDDSSKAHYERQIISEYLEAKDYWPDVFANRFFYYDSQRCSKDVIIEINGDSHHSKIGTVKDERRDTHFRSIGIPTIRFPISRVIGKKAWSDEVILNMIQEEIDYQLSLK